MKVNILTDNRVSKRGLLAEHGLSIFIETVKGNFLFDTGQSAVYLHNAQKMGLDLTKTDHLIISHGHYDHGGGLNYFPNPDQLPLVYVHERALGKRYKIMPDGNFQEVGLGWSSEFKLVQTQDYYQIMPGVILCGNIPQTVEFETVTPGFYQADKQTPDLLEDEQMLIFDVAGGLCIFLGCSHPGVANCLNQAKKLFPDKNINTLVAGMHLNIASPQRIQKTINFLQAQKIKNVVPLHCTGIMAITEIKRALGDACSLYCAGDAWEIV